MEEKTSYIIHNVKDALFLFITGGGIILRLAIGWFYLLSMERMLTSIFPTLQLPLWAALYTVFPIAIWFFYKKMSMTLLCAALLLSALINNVILYLYNPISPI